MRLLSIFSILILFNLSLSTHSQETSPQILFTISNLEETLIQRFMPLTNTTETILEVASDLINCFEASDDGTILTYTIEDNSSSTIFVFDTRRNIMLLEIGGVQPILCPKLSFNGHYLAYTDVNNVILFDTLNSVSTEIVSFDDDISMLSDISSFGPAGGDLRWSPNSQILAFTAIGDVYIWRNGKIIQVTDTNSIVEDILGWSPLSEVLAIQSDERLADYAFMGLYDINDNEMWIVTDELDGSNTIRTKEWQPHTNHFTFALSSNSVTWLADPETQELISLTGDTESLVLWIRWLPDGENFVVLYLENIEGDYYRDYFIENIDTREQVLIQHRISNNLRADIAPFISPNNNILIIDWLLDSQIIIDYYDMSNETLTRVLETDTNVEIQLDQLVWSPDGRYFATNILTNYEPLTEASQYYISVVDVTNGEEAILGSVPYFPNVVAGRPFIKWIMP